MDPKSILQSRTFWANVIALIIWAFALFGIAPQLSPEVAEFVEAVGPGILAVVNIILRARTTQPVTIP